jgi:DNA-binding response OmpR family regulator
MPPSAPIVVLTHDGAPSERARFIWAGASACVTKPLNVVEIDETVGMLLEVAATR